MSKYELHLGMSKLSLTEILKHEMTFKFKEIIRLFIYIFLISFLEHMKWLITKITYKISLIK